MKSSRFGRATAFVLVLSACGDGEALSTSAGAGGGGATSTTSTSGGGTGGAAGGLCTSIANEVYQSPLAASDPCKLPGADAQGPPQPPPAKADGPLDPLARGPYAIGVTTLELTSADRKIKVEVWYPATDAAVGQANDVYTYPEDAPKGAVDGVEAACLQLDPLDSGAVRDAAPALDGSFPLVIFSHGTTSTRVQSASQTSHLATHGFVVAAPDHTGDTLLEFFDKKGQQNPLDDPLAAAAVAANRVADVSAIIDAMEKEGAATAGCFAGRVDASKVGVFGHSFGGFTALAASGGMVIGASADPRVSAILPIAPAIQFTKASDDPILAMGGADDLATPFETQTEAAYERSTAPKHLVKLEGAGHLTVSDMCLLKLDEQVKLFGFEPCSVCTIVNEGCPGGVDQMMKARPPLQYFTAAFFIAYLGTGARADEAKALLDPMGDGPTKFPSAWAGAVVK